MKKIFLWHIFWGKTRQLFEAAHVFGMLEVKVVVGRVQKCWTQYNIFFFIGGYHKLL